ncbi:MAG: alcohol dehydrogenase catalytic domain-containing protein, partial [Acidimicrobiales bacterium]|nr:alcohol dehydrogenase catalytic domain-containing protein [Acidimicrobiales bacterium]
MRAALLHTTGDEKLDVVDDIEIGEPGPGEVVVKIEATGVCHSDLHAMEGSLPQGAPFVPGHEGAGVVTAVGDGVDTLAVGDHVVVAWSP